MPFYIYKNNEFHLYERGKSAPLKKDPIFLFPDIAGNPIIFNRLCFNIYQNNPEQPVFVYLDPQIRNPAGTHIKTTQQLGQDAAKEILEITEGSDWHLKVGGFSRGGQIAVATAQALKNNKKAVTTCVIDSPAPSKSKLYFVQNNPKATRDLISIMGQAAHLAKLPTRFIHIDDEQLIKLTSQSVLDQLSDIKHLFSKAQNEEFLDPKAAIDFLMYFQVIAKNIRSLLGSELDSETYLDNLLVLTTKETRDKYICDKNAAWNKYSAVIKAEHIDGTHLSLLEDKDQELSTKMTLYFTEKALEASFLRQINAASPKKTATALSPSLSPSHGSVSLEQFSLASPGIDTAMKISEDDCSSKCTRKPTKLEDKSALVSKLGNWGTMRQTRRSTREAMNLSDGLKVTTGRFI